MHPMRDRDTRLRFDAEAHRYWVDDVEYASVTTLLSQFFPAFDPDKVIDKMWTRWQKPGSKYVGMSPDAIKEKWQQEGDASREAGTLLHRQIQTFFTQGRMADTPAFRQFIKMHRETGGETPVKMEWPIYSTRFRVAGTIDALYRDKDGYVLRDWKHAKEIKAENRFGYGLGPLAHLEDCNFIRYSLQLHLYRQILVTEYQMAPLRLEIVNFPPGGTYRIYRAHSLENEAARLLIDHQASLT